MKVPEVAIPIRHKRNSAVFVGVARNQRLKNKGHFTANDLDKKLQEEIIPD
ncbi:hypothetical protein AGMMS49587_20590 [Spirochaetia bacterium]|nr:hypothetical protein AGMMS49587_20590 [Spirochaetia bacterium]